MGSYDKFKELFEKFSKEAGKEQYLIPYFIAAHPGTTDEDMMNLALWLKKNNFRLDQVQTFMPTPMAMATTMWHTRRNPLKKLARSSEKVDVVRDGYRRKLHKAFLRYHHPDNWQILYEALINMGREDLIGYGKHQLIAPVPPQSGNNATPRGQRFNTARTAHHPTQRFQDAPASSARKPAGKQVGKGNKPGSRNGAATATTGKPKGRR